MTGWYPDATHSAVSNLPANLQRVGGYVTGTSGIKWTAADWNKFPNAGHVRYDQGYSWPPAPGDYDVLDVENMAVTPSEVPAAIDARIKAGYKYTWVYATDSYLAAIQAALNNHQPGVSWWQGHVRCVLANWNLNQAEATALLGTTIHGMICDAVQWASPSSNPRTLLPGTNLTLAQANADLNVCSDSFFPPNTPAPVPTPTPPPVTPKKGLLVMPDLTSKVVSSTDGKNWS